MSCCWVSPESACPLTSPSRSTHGVPLFCHPDCLSRMAVSRGPPDLSSPSWPIPFSLGLPQAPSPASTIREHVLKCEQGPLQLSLPDFSPTLGTPSSPHLSHPGPAPAGLAVVYHSSQQPALPLLISSGRDFNKALRTAGSIHHSAPEGGWALMDTRQPSAEMASGQQPLPKPLGDGEPQGGGRRSQESPLLGALGNKP